MINKFTSIIIIAGLWFLAFSDDSYNLNFEFPYGTGNIQTTVTNGSHVRSLISIESFVHEKKYFSVIVSYPSILHPVNLLEYNYDSSNTLQLPFELRTQNDIWYYLIEFNVDSSAISGRYDITCIPDSSAHFKSCKTSFFVVDKNYAATHLRLTSLMTPCDERGNFLENQQKNTIVIKDQSSGFLRSFYVSDKEHDGDHVAFQFENSGNYPALLDVNYLIRDINNGQAVDWLDNLRQESGLDQSGINLQVYVAPHSSTKSVLTIRSRTNVLVPGEFMQNLTATMFTSNSPFIDISEPLFIRKINASNINSTIFAIFFAIAGILLMIIYHRKIWGRLSSREYILIAIYSAIAFTTVSIPSSVLYSFVHAFLGPFSFLFTGIFSEIISYMLLVSLVVLLPRPGVITSYLLIKFMLSAIVLGNLSVISVLWYPMRAVILELVFYLSGFFDNTGNRLIFDNVKTCLRNRLSVYRAAIMIALADAILAYISLNMTMFFYRLFYADWYVWLYVSVSGFLYTLISVPIGIRLGNGLRKVVID